jgi:23S rRNA (cytidine1920-2'-O)/16S rRNA (cytidine1409-2'-O)-methyltransferase
LTHHRQGFSQKFYKSLKFCIQPLIKCPSLSKPSIGMKNKLRADELLVANGACESRTRAQALILAGKVKWGTERIDKASRLIPAGSVLTVEKPFPYVGRGGLKMENFLKESGWDVTGLSVLDLGASTGGFTDCLLQHGAIDSTCVDVGHGQLHYKLRTDSRVTNLEKTNLRDLMVEKLPQNSYPLIVMDLSFISLCKVLNHAWSFLCPGGKLLALVKPQFECTKEEADRGKGVIRDSAVQERVINEVTNFAELHLENSSLIAQFLAKPHGTDGNLEFFLGWEKTGSG